jgi:hypothetical protein
MRPAMRVALTPDEGESGAAADAEKAKIPANARKERMFMLVNHPESGSEIHGSYCHRSHKPSRQVASEILKRRPKSRVVDLHGSSLPPSFRQLRSRLLSGKRELIKSVVTALVSNADHEQEAKRYPEEHAGKPDEDEGAGISPDQPLGPGHACAEIQEGVPQAVQAGCRR